ncbi:Primase C terminal 1 (PriCT-1) [Pelagirhabdus alkalitolerans]|uniref:Primase C terminal 1 (PriCT-1) n=1 Tax=Pelagirhabdus alkalitolerans TaxID=1612202 RepID=A0A1G6N1A2_9BACI|nr:primase C-terminal domain-containing protein [Pelagirhabdus alkalitolerans]SDC61244.1 Primase C terminal 1 (PriCT-1) [Pelagirhabdus alkalitolerans]
MASVLKGLYGDQLTEEPSKQMNTTKGQYHSHLAWGFITNDFLDKPTPFRTYSTLFQVSERATYYTPNSFYRNDQRQKKALRWLNAMVVDIDVNGDSQPLTLIELIDRIDEAGLPNVSLVVSTPSGGFHVYWFFEEPRRAFPKVTDHYERIQTEVAKALGGDFMAIGAERWFRLPKADNVAYRTENRVSFDELCDWFTINYENNTYQSTFHISKPNSLFEHPAVKKLLQGVSEGKRDNTCYTLALACKAEGYCKDQTIHLLLQWNLKNEPPMSNREIYQKVRSAYKKGSPSGPSSYWLSVLSGIHFSYQKWDPAKERKDRVYSHRDEWEQDVIRTLRRKGGELKGSQKEIAQQIQSYVDPQRTIPLSTLKKVVKRFLYLGLITKEVTGYGRNACTTLRLVTDHNVYLLPSIKRKKRTKINRFNSNTFIDPVAGGLCFMGLSP